MRDRLRLLLAIPLFCLAVTLSGCDAQVTVNPEVAGDTARLEGRVEALEAEVQIYRVRATSLQAEVDRLQEESVVLHGADGYTMRLNTPAALVLIMGILGATVCIVARVKYRPAVDDQ